MTPEDKKIVADYMNDEGALYNCAFDCNYASLVVQEMQKRGDWERFCANVFILFIDEEKSSYLFPKYIAWLFNADNFFKGFVEWRKGNEQG